MTNLLFSIVVTLITNTSESFGGYQQMPLGQNYTLCPNGMAIGDLLYRTTNVGEPTTKTVTTVTERVTNAVARLGEREIKTELGRCQLESVSVTYTKEVKTVWNAAPPVTNAPMSARTVQFATNGAFFSLLVTTNLAILR